MSGFLDPLRNRTTVDTVVLVLCGVVAAVIVLSTLAVLWISVTDTEHTNVEQLAKQVGDLTGALIAALVGYLAGRGVSTTAGKNGNGREANE